MKRSNLCSILHNLCFWGFQPYHTQSVASLQTFYELDEGYRKR